MASPTKKVKVCYILSYRSPNYVRTNVLLAALRQIPNVQAVTAINSAIGLWRYPQTIGRLIKARLTERPDVYILGFRGHEILGLVRILTAGKPLIFDEFINLDNWLVSEHHKLSEKSPIRRVVKNYLAFFMGRCQKILSDTKLHAESSAKTYGLPIAKYQPIYVGADEALFRPADPSKNKQFTVFFYSTWLPLHGINIITAAAKKLKDAPIKFVLVGANEDKEEANVRILSRVSYEKLPAMIAEADLCLGGPFGDTPQSRLVVSGKTFQFLAMAKPTVVGKIAEEDGFLDHKNCLLVDQGSAGELAEAIKWAYQNRTKLPAIGRVGHELYEECFSVERISEKLEQVIVGLYES